ncbi:MAG: hypothetical protein PHO08_08755 [Methylococcales bacterium]|nr:hypothetical protein [Methylococcales bacterium]
MIFIDRLVIADVRATEQGLAMTLKFKLPERRRPHQSQRLRRTKSKNGKQRWNVEMRS